MNSKLGYVLSGPLNYNRVESSTVNLTYAMKVEMCIKEDISMEQKVGNFWNLDSVGIVADEESVYDKFESTIKYEHDRCEVMLPFKENRPMLEDNYAVSLRRLKSLKVKLDKTPDILQEYDDVIKKQLETGVIERADSPVELEEVIYLPHRAVVREGKSTKVRVVFDASAKTPRSNRSLNDCLYKGPCQTPLLYDILIRFRIHNIAINSDLEKAYLQISVAPELRNYLRFVWYQSLNDTNLEIIKCFTRVIFGACCSQYLLNLIVKTHLQKYADKDPEFVEKMMKSFYVDDLISGTKNLEEGVKLFRKCKVRFLEANFNLRKWRTDDERLRQIIDESKEVKISDNVGDKKNN